MYLNCFSYILLSNHLIGFHIEKCTFSAFALNVYFEFHVIKYSIFDIKYVTYILCVFKYYL